MTERDAKLLANWFLKRVGVYDTDELRQAAWRVLGEPAAPARPEASTDRYTFDGPRGPEGPKTVIEHESEPAGNTGPQCPDCDQYGRHFCEGRRQVVEPAHATAPTKNSAPGSRAALPNYLGLEGCMGVGGESYPNP